jgi:hypothetical protein
MAGQNFRSVSRTNRVTKAQLVNRSSESMLLRCIVCARDDDTMRQAVLTIDKYAMAQTDIVLCSECAGLEGDITKRTALERVARQFVREYKEPRQ